MPDQAVGDPGPGSRHDQAFPVLTLAEMDRMRRFGTRHDFAEGGKLFETGKPGPGMFVVLSGRVAITQRDGLGHSSPVAEQGPGQFLAEVGQISGRVTLVDGVAVGEVEVLLVPPERFRALLVAEADLGERIMRALILRRVSLISSGFGGAVLVGARGRECKRWFSEIKTLPVWRRWMQRKATTPDLRSSVGGVSRDEAIDRLTPPLRSG